MALIAANPPTDTMYTHILLGFSLLISLLIVIVVIQKMNEISPSAPTGISFHSQIIVVMIPTNEIKKPTIPKYFLIIIFLH